MRTEQKLKDVQSVDENRNEIFSLMYNFDMPFVNNIVELNLRITKVKKNLWNIWSLDDANAFLEYFDAFTVWENGLKTLDCISSIFISNPIDPTLIY